MNRGLLMEKLEKWNLWFRLLNLDIAFVGLIVALVWSDEI